MYRCSLWPAYMKASLIGNCYGWILFSFSKVPNKRVIAVMLINKKTIDFSGMPSSNLTLRIWDHCSTGYYWGRFWIAMLTHRHRGVMALMLNSLSLNKILSNSLATHCWIVCSSMSWHLTNFQIKIYQDIIHQRIWHINVLYIYIYIESP